MSRVKVDLAGQRFGRLVAISEHGRRHGSVTWICRCDCGKECIVIGYYLRQGQTRSCGCLRKQTYVENMTRARRGGDMYRKARALADVFAKPQAAVEREEKTWNGAAEAADMLGSLW